MRGLLFRYLLGELAPPIVMGILTFSGILMVGGVFRVSEYLVAGGSELAPIAGLLSSMVPYLLILTIPMALLLSIMITYGRLSEENEILAMRAGGVSYRSIYAPAVAVGVFLFLLMLFIENRLAPAAHQMETRNISRLLETALPPDLRPGQFNTRYGSFPIYFREVDTSRRALYGVLIGSVTDAELELVVSSPEANVDLDTDSGTLVLTLHSGTMNSLGGDRISDARFDQAKAHLDVSYRLERLTRGTNEWMAFSTSELMKKAREVRALPDTEENRYFKSRLGRMYRDWNERFSVPAICLAIPLVAVPLALVTRTGRRSAAFVASMFLIFVYYLLLSLGKSIVSGSFVSAMIGSWFPVLVLLAVGLGLTCAQVRR